MDKLRAQTKRLKTASASEKEAELAEEVASVWVRHSLAGLGKRSLTSANRDSLNALRARKICVELLSPSALIVRIIG